MANLTWPHACGEPRNPSCELSFHWVVAASIFSCEGAAFGFSGVRCGLQWGVQLGLGGGGTSPPPGEMLHAATAQGKAISWARQERASVARQKTASKTSSFPSLKLPGEFGKAANEWLGWEVPKPGDLNADLYSGQHLTQKAYELWEKEAVGAQKPLLHPASIGCVPAARPGLDAALISDPRLTADF